MMLNKKTTATRYVDGHPEQSAELLTEEQPLQIAVNGHPYTITMQSPGQEKFLAVGVLFAEGLIRHREDVIAITEAVEGRRTGTVNVGVRDEALAGKNLFNRSIVSSSSCGVCGKVDLQDLVFPENVLRNSTKLDVRQIPDLLGQMFARQSTFETTGGSHAAAIFGRDGSLLTVQEDIGRHNAVDKAIGELFLKENLPEAMIMFVSGRVSYEIVIKCAAASIPFLLAVSAPSSMAVELCRQHGITLIGFCRENRATVYTHCENVLQHQPARQTSSHHNEL